MKPQSIIHYTAGIILICFAVACGAGENRNTNGSSPEEKKEAADEAATVTSEAAEKTAYKDAEGYADAASSSPEEEANDADYFKPKDSQAELKKVFSSSAAEVDPEDTLHKFVRTADIKFRVKNVANTTYRIEDITRKFKGFVTQTYLNSRVDHISERIVSKDSILQTTYYTVENAITIRVPSKNLDTALKEIALLVEYLDYRNINANDVRFQILSNKLEKRRLARYNNRMSKISDNGNANYMDDKAYIEENLLQKQAQADQSLIEDLTLEDQIEYSTVTLYLYQSQDRLHELIPNEENIEEYKPSLGNRIGESLKTGWYFIEDAVVGLVAAWPLFLILGVVFIILRKNGYLKRKKNNE